MKVVSETSEALVTEGTRADTDLVIVTGLSGGGRSTVARALENVGYYVVDNLPQTLLIEMAELAYAAGGTARKTAMVLGGRSRCRATAGSPTASPPNGNCCSTRASRPTCSSTPPT